MDSDIPLEGAIVAGIMRRLKRAPGCKAIKTHGSAFSTVGTPDIIGSYVGRSFALEVKRPRVGVVAPKQRYELELWANAGAVAAVVESVEDVERVLQLG